MTQNHTDHGQNSEISKNKQAFLFENEEDLDNLLNGAFEQDQQSQEEKPESEFEFRPLTKGLGFHQEKRHQKPATRKSQSQRNSGSGPSRKTTQSVNSVQRPTPQPQSKVRENNYAMKNELSAFYGESVISTQETTTTEQTEKKVESEVAENTTKAGLGKMFGAYLVDLLCIIGFYAAMMGSVVMASGLNPQELLELFTMQERIIFAASLFTLIYLFYFSVLDLGGTIGKSLFGISVQKTDQSRLTIFSTFNRSLVSLFSLLLAGFPMAFDFQGKLSDTEVVSK